MLNKLGITTQNPSVYEICSNNATTKQRKINVDNFNLIIYKPMVEITDENYKELQFLDLMLIVDKYSELSKEELKKKLRKYIETAKINFDLVKTYLPLYPDKIFKNLFYGGVMNELV